MSSKPLTWIEHVKAVRLEKGLSYKEALEEASKTYVKKTPKIKKPKKMSGRGALSDKAIEILNSRPANVKRFLASHGDKIVKNVMVCRTPIRGVISLILELITGGKISEVKNAFDYEDIFHLYLIIVCTDGSIFSIEKNSIVKIIDYGVSMPPPRKDSKCVFASSDAKINILDLITEAEKINPNLYRYTAWTYNCQDFLNTLVSILGLNKNLSSFIMQDFTESFQDSSVKFISQGITDALGFIEKLKGNGD